MGRLMQLLMWTQTGYGTDPLGCLWNVQQFCHPQLWDEHQSVDRTDVPPAPRCMCDATAKHYCLPSEDQLHDSLKGAPHHFAFIDHYILDLSDQVCF